MAPQYSIVTKTVTDLRREPRAGEPSYRRDDGRETQLLYNELLVEKGRDGEWVYVEAVEQPVYRKHSRWEGYPGWVRADALLRVDAAPANNLVIRKACAEVFAAPTPGSPPLGRILLGTRLMSAGPGESPQGFLPVVLAQGERGWVRAEDAGPVVGGPIDAGRLRSALTGTARLFEGVPYLWGGRSIGAADTGEVGPAGTIMGVDCSGLVNLVYRVHGIDIPRDAYEQWMAADAIAPHALQPGDLVFVSPGDDPGAIAHVLLYGGGERCIEAAETGLTVRWTDFSERFGSDLAAFIARWTDGEPGRVRFGTLLDSRGEFPAGSR